MVVRKIVLIGLLFSCFSIGATNLGLNWSKENKDLGVHPIHISFTTIEYNNKESRFKILFKIFVDDFDLILKLKYGYELNLEKGKWGDNHQKIVDKYLLEHFRLVFDNKDKTKSALKFQKREIKEQAIWLYYDFKSKVKSDIFNIQNSLMTDLYPDQKNLLIFVFKGNERAIKFDVEETKQRLSF